MGNLRPPVDAGPAGRKLWRSVCAEYSLSGADLEILKQAVLIADELDGLESLVRASGPLIRDRNGEPKANPAAVSHRLLAITYARLLAAIQVIGDVAETHDPARPQRRMGVRGTYTLKAVE
jgi:hypothetical protein